MCTVADILAPRNGYAEQLRLVVEREVRIERMRDLAAA
jgi:hypothetical protein